MKTTEFIVKRIPEVKEEVQVQPESTPIRNLEMMQFNEGAANYALDLLLNEMATGGASGAGGIAVSMGGPGYKPGTGKPKKITNAHKSKKVTVGKGIY